MKINARPRKIRRLALLLGLVGATAGMALLTAAPAQADPVGTQPGNVSLVPTSGVAADAPTWATTTACPAAFNTSAVLTAFSTDATPVLLASVSPFVAGPTAPFSGPLLSGFTMGAIASGLGIAGTTTEWVILCTDVNGNNTPVQSTFVTFSGDASTWTSAATPPTGATATTMSLIAAPTTAAPGDSVDLTATVSPSAAAGAVEFFDGATSLGAPVAVASGTAAKSVSTLTSGSHSITAHFVPTDSAAFGASTSSPATVTITGGGSSNAGSETINVNIPTPQDAGVFAVTVSNTPVSLGTAAPSGGMLEATGALSPVTVSEGRNVTKPGWNISGQVGDFTQGSNVIDGNSLGWAPAVTTQNAAGDVVAGAVIAAGANPGLKQGGTLAGAATSKGVGTTVLGGSLDLKVPTTTNPGDYSATLTITALDTAS